MIEYNLITNKAIDSFEYEQQVLRSLSAEKLNVKDHIEGEQPHSNTKLSTFDNNEGAISTKGNSYHTSCNEGYNGY